MKSIQHWASKADALAHKTSISIGLGRPYVKAKVVAKRLRNRAGLLRLAITGRAPFLTDMEDDWFVTKTQVLLAHETLSKDIFTLRDRIEAVAKRTGQASIYDPKVKQVAPKVKVVQVDKNMSVELKPDV